MLYKSILIFLLHFKLANGVVTLIFEVVFYLVTCNTHCAYTLSQTVFQVLEIYQLTQGVNAFMNLNFR